jgi:hypothetical protein
MLNRQEIQIVSGAQFKGPQTFIQRSHDLVQMKHIPLWKRILDWLME